VGIGLWTINDRNTHLIPKWYVTKKGRVSVEHVIEVGSTGSECFAQEPIRGWRWISLYGQMDKYFVDIVPLRSNLAAWFVFVVFDSAAQHIMNTISKGRPPSTGMQLTLGGE
jgi:hypothetical protein